MRPSIKNIKEHIENQIEINDFNCWLWTGHTDKDGYGNITIKRKSKRTHRVYWEIINGPIPKGMWVLHTCDVPSCINLNHLFLGTHTDNMRDKVKKGRDFNKSKTHCIRDHEFNEKNTRHHTRPNGESHRTCRPCDALRSKSYRKKTNG